MSKLSFLGKNHTYIYLDETSPSYFGFYSGCLDMHTMRYRIFGAVWKLINAKRYILGYWFADTENDIRLAIQEAGYSAANKSQKSEIEQIYQAIRAEQDKENWTKRLRMHFLLLMRKPWKELSIGWYVLKSGNDFPLVLTCIQKKRCSIWIEHIKVCENKEDVKNFLNQVHLDHDLKFLPEIMEGQFYNQIIT